MLCRKRQRDRSGTPASAASPRLGEGVVLIVPVRRGVASRRDVHVDEAKSTRRISAGKEKHISISGRTARVSKADRNGLPRNEPGASPGKSHRLCEGGSSAWQRYAH